MESLHHRPAVRSADGRASRHQPDGAPLCCTAGAGGGVATPPSGRRSPDWEPALVVAQAVTSVPAPSTST